MVSNIAITDFCTVIEQESWSKPVFWHLICKGFFTYVANQVYYYYDEAIHQRNSKVYIYAYIPVHGLVCIIYTSYVLRSPEECFNSTNESISSDRYRRTKFLAKMAFHIVHQYSPQYLYVPHPKQICLVL